MTAELLFVCLEAWRELVFSESADAELATPFDKIASETLATAGNDVWKPLQLLPVQTKDPQRCHKWQPWDVCRNVGFLYTTTKRREKQQDSQSSTALEPKESLSYSHLGTAYQ